MALRSDQSISIVFPAYNEEENICEAVTQAISHVHGMFRQIEVIVVNDGSSDRTGALIDEMAKKDGRIKQVVHEKNRGYGSALKSGFSVASSELIFFCDSDLQFHITELLLLLVWAEQYDAVIGYRAKRHDKLHRKLNAFCWNMLVRLVLGINVKDIDCAFKLFKSYIFDYIDIESVGAMVNTEILSQIDRMGFRIKQIPVTHFPRVRGSQTGANLRVIIKAFKELGKLHSKLKQTRKIVFDYNEYRSTM